MSTLLPTALPSGNHWSAKEREMMTDPVASSALPLSPVTIGTGMSDRKLESTHRAFCTRVSSPIEVLRSSPLRDLVPISRQMASMSG